MQLQLALDFETVKNVKKIIQETMGMVDIYEIGTPLLLREGSRLITDLKKCFSEVTLLADAKIMDAGYEEAALLFEAGADIVTVLACTDISTLKNCVRCAKEYGRQIMMDTIGVEDIDAVREKVALAGVGYVCAHRSVDKELAGTEAGRTDISDLEKIKAMGGTAKTAIAGGIRTTNLTEVIAQAPDVIIIGRAITSSEDIASAVRKIRGMINE